MDTPDSGLKLTAYKLENTHMPIVPATKFRDWMSNWYNKHPYRCLPLMMANQSGWFLLNPERFVARWDGGGEENAVQVRIMEPDAMPHPVVSNHFGWATLTWRVPYLFRTPPGYNLLVRGPANWPKPFIYPLEGLVETDWNAMPFTMNWMITTPKQFVVFEKGEPFCMIVPQKRHEIETFETELKSIREDKDQAKLTYQSLENRSAQNYNKRLDPHVKQEHLHYFHGRDVTGQTAPEHQTKLELHTFQDHWQPAPAPGTYKELQLSFKDANLPES